MKDILGKLSAIEASAPKKAAKKMLNEDSTTPPMNVSNKPASLKDVFENMAMQRPIPVVGKQGDTQETGAGFLHVTDNSPAAQALSNAFGDLASQGKAQIVMPTSGQKTGQQTQQTKPTGQAGQQQQTGQSAKAGATGQQLDELSPDLLKRAGAEASKRQQAAKGPQSLGTEFEGGIELGYEVNGQKTHVVSPSEAAEHIEKGILTPDTRVIVFSPSGRKTAMVLASKVPALKAMFNPQTPGSKFWGMKADKFGQAAKAATSRDQAKDYSAQQTAGMSPAQKRQFDAMSKSGALAEEQLDELSPKTLASYTKKASDDLVDRAEDHAYMKSPERVPGGYTKAIARNQAKGLNRQQGISRAVDKLSGNAKVPANEGAKVDRMVKHIAKSERKLGKSKDEAEDIAWATANKRGMLDNKNKKKMKEADIPSTNGIDTMGAGLGAGRSRTTLEGKKPDFLDLDKDGNKKEPMKKAAADKKKKKVDESMNHRISAARFEGKSHGLKGHAHCGKSYEDLEEMKAYHEGYIDGLNECYGQGVYETAMPATVPGMASAAMEADLKVGMSDHLAAKKIADKIKGTPNLNINSIKSYVAKYIGMVGKAPTDVDYIATLVLDELENQGMMDEGNAFTAALAKTPKGGKFSVGGKTFTDRTSYDANVNEYAFESLDNQLNALLNESEEVTEGLSVSISKGQQNSPDSVTITAQDQEAEHLLAFVKNAGLGLFGDDHDHSHSSAMSIQPAHGAPDEVGAGGVDIGVVDGHDGMMGLMQKLTGIQGGDEDYADEEGDEEHLYGNDEAADKKDCGCDGDCECSDYDKPSNEGMCNECGGMMEAGHSCGSKEMVDEVESEDQMEFEVAEDNAPDSGAAETTADENAEAEEDKALALKSVNESFADILARLEKLAEGSGDEPKHPKHDEKDDKDYDDEEDGPDHGKAWSDTSDELKEDSEKEDEKAGKKVTKDIEYDDKKDKKEKIDEWANEAGKKGTDAAFEADIDFMTKVIAGGLNKPKSTGQTTVPVIAGQESRMHDHQGTVSDSVDDWVKLAGIK